MRRGSEPIAIAAQRQPAIRAAQQAADSRAAGGQARSGHIGDGALEEDRALADPAARSRVADGEGGGPSSAGRAP